MNFTVLDDGRVDGFALVKSVEKKTSSKGDIYLDFTLADKSGEINAKLWRYNAEEHGEYNTNDIIKIRGTVSPYNGADQLKIERIRVALPQDNVDINELIKFHNEKGQIATMTAINIGQQFGCLDIDGEGNVSKFREKNELDGNLINAGYMVLEPAIFDYIEGDSTVFEKAPIEQLAKDGQLNAFIHNGFWKCMDTVRDKNQLESLIESNTAPWIVWEE